MDYRRLSYEINIYTPAFRHFWENIGYVIIFYKISASEQKRTWFVTQIPIIPKKRSAYTQGDNSGLSYDINIYIPAFRHFEKKLHM